MLGGCMVEPESEPGFRVRDRRRGGDESESGPPPLIDAQAPQAKPKPPEPPPPSAVESAGGDRSLVGLFMMLGNLAAASLQGVPDPATGHVQPDPGQAAEIIDVLVLLRERTEGHRTPEETQALDEVIYELQVRYVRATTRP